MNLLDRYFTHHKRNISHSPWLEDFDPATGEGHPGIKGATQRGKRGSLPREENKEKMRNVTFMVGKWEKYLSDILKIEN